MATQKVNHHQDPIGTPPTSFGREQQDRKQPPLGGFLFP